jgi:hypothetical protein
MNNYPSLTNSEHLNLSICVTMCYYLFLSENCYHGMLNHKFLNFWHIFTIVLFMKSVQGFEDIKTKGWKSRRYLSVLYVSWS